MKSSIAIAIVLGALLGGSHLHAEVDGLPGASGNSFMRHRGTGPALDREAQRAQVDETQSLLDALARESRGLDKTKIDPLFKSLREEYGLGDFVGKARKALAQAEEVLEVQEAIKAQQKEMITASATDMPALESKLLGLQSDLIGIVDALRGTLRDVHANADVDKARDFRNWIMISEGLLRGRREAAAQASPVSANPVTPVTEVPLTFEGISPSTGSDAAETKTSKP